MFRIRLLLTLALAGFATAAGTGGGQVQVPDGSPDITGTWVGTFKFKSFDQHENRDDRGRGKLPIQCEIAQTGPDVSLTLFVETDEGVREFALSGQVGQGQVWAFLQEPGAVIMLMGRVKRTGMKGKVLIAEDATIAEARFGVKRDPGTPQVSGPGTLTDQADGLPAIAGNWSGKHKWKGFAQYDTGAEKGQDRGKNQIALTIAQAGVDVTVTYTIFTDEGQDEIPLAGEHGNGHFWATGTHPRGGPMMVVGHVKRGKIRGSGLTSFDGAVFEAKFTVSPGP